MEMSHACCCTLFTGQSKWHACLIDSKGKEIELSMAQEALGLVSTLGWHAFKGPKTFDVDEEEEEVTQAVKQDTEGRHSNVLSKSANINQYRRENIKDGDYVYGPDGLMEGVYYRGGGIIDFK